MAKDLESEQDRIDEFMERLLSDNFGQVYYKCPIENTEYVSSTERIHLISALEGVGLDAKEEIAYPQNRIVVTGIVPRHPNSIF